MNIDFEKYLPLSGSFSESLEMSMIECERFLESCRGREGPCIGPIGPAVGRGAAATASDTGSDWEQSSGTWTLETRMAFLVNQRKEACIC